jgi:aromatase
MDLYRHSIEVACTREAAFTLTLDVAHWPKYFPPCKAVKILSQSDSEQRIEITAEANNEIFTWQSARSIDHKNHIITFHQVKPSPLVSHMQGAWRFDEVTDGTLISIEHECRVKENVAGLVEAVVTCDDARAYMGKTIHGNSVKELQSMKEILESLAAPKNPLWLDFKETLLIDKDIADIHRLLWDAKNWHRLLPHCDGIDILYDDGGHQEFVMHIQAGGVPEVIRTIRASHANYKISYFQATPPPVLTHHEGYWELIPTDNGVLVTSFHRVALNRAIGEKLWGNISSSEMLEKIKMAINQNSLMTLHAIADFKIQEEVCA